VPEAGEPTSIKPRVEHVEQQGHVETLKAAESGSMAAQTVCSGLEESLWLCPIEDRRGLASTCDGMVEGLTLGNSLWLVESSGPLFREGKASISGELAGVFARLGSDGESWSARLLKLSRGRLLGRYFASSRKRLSEVADHLELHHLENLGWCPART
jgi:hypothetical protein